MNQVYCRALAALVVAAALAACGASDDEPQRVANDGDLATYGVESLFSVGVPSDWRTLTADEVFTDEVLETIREANPELGPTLDAIAAPGSPMKLFAVDPDLGDGISTYMNVVVVQGAPDDVTREDYFEAISAEVEGADVTDLREERIELPAGEALQLTFEHSQSGVEKPLAVLQYVLFANRTG
jgi:hypothetical protein